MKRLLMLVLALGALSVPTSQGATLVFRATLDGPSENPPVASPGTGSAKVRFDTTTRLIQVSITFKDLVGTTTVAHIHCCADAPASVGVATFPGTFPGFPAMVTGGSYLNSWDLGEAGSYTASFLTNFGGGTAAGAESALLSGMAGGRAYVNVHSSAYPGGEIRGFLAPAGIPEPASAGLGALGIGAAMFVAGRRRRNGVRKP